MSETKVYLAVDLGASSGRVMAGCYDGRRLSFEEVHRFPNGPEEIGGSYRWDIEGLFGAVKTGLGKAGEQYKGSLVSVGVDTWGVDYGLLDGDGRLLGRPFAYRDERTNGMEEEAARRLPRREIYAITGIQFMFFNTLYQLLSEVASDRGELKQAEQLLFVPDLLHYWLSGSRVNEYSIASTSQLLDARTGSWSDRLLEAMGIPRGIFGEIVQPGTSLGPLLPVLAEELGLRDLSVVAPGAHDTASAVAAVPVQTGARSAYLSSGTWSLMGVEADTPVIDDESYRFSFTNEGGVCGKIRLLKNICGLWLIQECRRVWAEAGEELDFGTMVEMAEQAKPFAAFIDPDNASFATPGDMPQRVADYCAKTGQAVPESKGAVIRVCLEALALRYRWVMEMLEAMTGERVDVLHIVGGGAQNELLNQFAADAVGRTVVAGPVEATAAGNVLMQMLADGELETLNDGRRLIDASFETTAYEPRATNQWAEAYTRFKEITGS